MTPEWKQAEQLIRAVKLLAENAGRIAASLETLERCIGRVDDREGFVRTIDIGREI